MGAAPSRETHRRGLFSLEQVSNSNSNNNTTTSTNSGGGKKQDIVLIPLTKEFFPSPDCPLFVQFHKARCDAAVNYYFRRPGNPGDLSRIPTYGVVRPKARHHVHKQHTHIQKPQQQQQQHRHHHRHQRNSSNSCCGCGGAACDEREEQQQQRKEEGGGEAEVVVQKAAEDQPCMSPEHHDKKDNTKEGSCIDHNTVDSSAGSSNNNNDDRSKRDKAENDTMAATNEAADVHAETQTDNSPQADTDTTALNTVSAAARNAASQAVPCAKCGRVHDMKGNEDDEEDSDDSASDATTTTSEEEEEDVSYPSREALYRGVIERVEEALFDTDAEMREAYAWSSHRSPSPGYYASSSSPPPPSHGGNYYSTTTNNSNRCARKKILPVLCAVAFRTDLSKLNSNSNSSTAMSAGAATYGMPNNTTISANDAEAERGAAAGGGGAAQGSSCHAQAMLENGVYAFNSIINVVGCFGFVSMEEEVQTPRWGSAGTTNNNNDNGCNSYDEGEGPGLPYPTSLHSPNTHTTDNHHSNHASSLPPAAGAAATAMAHRACDARGEQTHNNNSNNNDNAAAQLQGTHTTSTAGAAAASVTSYRHDPYSYSNSIATSGSDYGGSQAGHSRVPSSISCASAPFTGIHAPPPQQQHEQQPHPPSNDLRASLLSLTALGRGGPYDIMTLPPPVAAPLAAMVYLTKSAGEQNLGRITYIAACTYYYQLLQAGVICRYGGLAPATSVRVGTTNTNTNTNNNAGDAAGPASPSAAAAAAALYNNSEDGYLAGSAGQRPSTANTNNNGATRTSASQAQQQSAWHGFNSAFLPRECLPPMETFSFSSLLTNIPILCFLYEMKWRWGYLGILKTGTPTAMHHNNNNNSFASSSMGSAREASAAAAFGRHVRQKHRNAENNNNHTNTNNNYLASSMASSFSAASAYMSPSHAIPPYTYYSNSNNSNISYYSYGEGGVNNTSHAAMAMMRGTTHSTGGLTGIDGSSGQSLTDEMEMWITADSMIHGRISKDLAERLCWSLAERPEVMQERVTHLPSVEDGYWRYRGLVDRQHPPPLPRQTHTSGGTTTATAIRGGGGGAGMPGAGAGTTAMNAGVQQTLPPQQDSNYNTNDGSDDAVAAVVAPVIHPKDVYVMGSDVLPGFDEGDILRYDPEHGVWFADHAIPLEGVVLAAMRPYCKQAREADPTDPNWVTRLVSAAEAEAMESEDMSSNPYYYYYNNNTNNEDENNNNNNMHGGYPTPPPTALQAQRMAADPSLRLVHEHVGHFFVYRFCMDGTTYYHGTVPNFSNPKKRRMNNNNSAAQRTPGAALSASHKDSHELSLAGRDEAAHKGGNSGSGGGSSNVHHVVSSGGGEALTSRASPSQASLIHTAQQQQQQQMTSSSSLPQVQPGTLYKASSNNNGNNSTTAAASATTPQPSSAAPTSHALTTTTTTTTAIEGGAEGATPAMPRGTIVVAGGEAATSNTRKASNTNRTLTTSSGNAPCMPAAIGRSIASALFFSSSCHDDGTVTTTTATGAGMRGGDYVSKTLGPATRHSSSNNNNNVMKGNAMEAGGRYGAASPHTASLAAAITAQQQQQQQQTSDSTHAAAASHSTMQRADQEGTCSAAAMAAATYPAGTNGGEVRRVASRDYGTAAQAPTRRRTSLATSALPTNEATNNTAMNTTSTSAPMFTPPSYLTSRVTSTAVDTARKWVRHLYSYAYGAQSRSRERGPSLSRTTSTSAATAATPSVRVGNGTPIAAATTVMMTGVMECGPAGPRGSSHSNAGVGHAEPGMAAAQTGFVPQQQPQPQAYNAPMQPQQQMMMMYAGMPSGNHTSGSNGYATHVPYAGNAVLQAPFRHSEAAANNNNTNNTNMSSNNNIIGYGQYPNAQSPAAQAATPTAVGVGGVGPAMQWSAGSPAASPNAGPALTHTIPPLTTAITSTSSSNTTGGAAAMPACGEAHERLAVQTIATTISTTTSAAAGASPMSVAVGVHTAPHELPASAPPPQEQEQEEGGSAVGRRDEGIASNGDAASLAAAAAALCSSPFPPQPQPVLRRIRRRCKIYPQPMTEAQVQALQHITGTNNSNNNNQQQVGRDEEGGQGATIVQSPLSAKRYVASGSYVWDWRPQ